MGAELERQEFADTSGQEGDRHVDHDALELGQKIRGFRNRGGLTMDALASTVGVSRSLISQVERGIASPSITTLRGIAGALGVPMAALFLDAESDGDGTTDSFGRQLVVRAQSRKRMFVNRARFVYELLTPDVEREIEFIRGELKPGATIPPESGAYVTHPGEENVYCAEGTLVFQVGRDEFVLEAGDSISFDCMVPHRVENRGSVDAILIAAVHPPSF